MRKGINAMKNANRLKPFIEDEAGYLICITDDMTFVKSVHFALTSYNKAYKDSIREFPTPGAATGALDEYRREERPIVILMEREIQGRKTTDAVIRIRRLYPKAKIIILASDVTKEVALYINELGVEAIIQKPISAENILLKINDCLEESKEQLLTEHVHALISKSRLREALEVLEKFELINKPSSLTYGLTGDVYLAEGDNAKAIGLYEKAHAANMHLIDPLKRLVAIYKFVDDDKALATLREIDRITPFNPERKMEMGEICLRQGDIASASSLFEAGYVQAAEEYFMLLGDYAERIFELLVDKIPELAGVFLDRATKGKRSLPTLDVRQFNRLGIAQREAGEWEKAVDTYTKALELIPDDPILHYNLALAYNAGNAESQAVDCLDRAVELDSEIHRGKEIVAYNIGSIYFRDGVNYKARLFLQHVLEINPDNEKARKKLATLNRSLKEDLHFL